MMSPGGSIVASLENVNGFLAVNTPPDDLIRTDFEKKEVVPKVMLHILEELVLLLGRHSLNEILRMVVRKVGKPWEYNLSEQSRLGIFLSKEIFEGGMIHIHNVFVHDEVVELDDEGVVYDNNVIVIVINVIVYLDNLSKLEFFLHALDVRELCCTCLTLIV
nr:hypothetical protein [Tanacetum cinerariifolium]